MSHTVTPLGPPALMATYGRVIAHLQQATGKQLSNYDSLCDFAKVIKERCDTDKHRQPFLKRARDVKDEISKRTKEANSLIYLQIRKESFYEYWGDKDRWIMEHGSIADWAEYMTEIGYTRYHESIHDHWTHRIRGVQDVEKLWSDLRMAEAA
jgi:predicted transglutaminase-like cysteine proteinase